MSKIQTLRFRLKGAVKAFQVDRELGKQWDPGTEPRFLFVVTPPYSGSTALVQLLNSSPKTAILEERGEGQWLVPGMGNSDRWSVDKKIDWEAVKVVWLKRVALLRSLVQDLDLFIEKSPPNMVRLEKLLETFPNHSLLAFNRNPYANCASIYYRFHNPEQLTESARKDRVEKLARDWIERSRWVREAIERYDCVRFTYEEFCANTQECLKLLLRSEPLLEGVECDRSVLVKDYQPQKITDQNERQISKLTEFELKTISEILSEERELVEFFNYQILE